MSLLNFFKKVPGAAVQAAVKSKGLKRSALPVEQPGASKLTDEEALSNNQSPPKKMKTADERGTNDPRGFPPIQPYTTVTSPTQSILAEARVSMLNARSTIASSKLHDPATPKTLPVTKLDEKEVQTETDATVQPEEGCTQQKEQNKDVKESLIKG